MREKLANVGWKNSSPGALGVCYWSIRLHSSAIFSRPLALHELVSYGVIIVRRVIYRTNRYHPANREIFICLIDVTTKKKKKVYIKCLGNINLSKSHLFHQSAQDYSHNLQIMRWTWWRNYYFKKSKKKKNPKPERKYTLQLPRSRRQLLQRPRWRDVRWGLKDTGVYCTSYADSARRWR